MRKLRFSALLRPVLPVLLGTLLVTSCRQEDGSLPFPLGQAPSWLLRNTTGPIQTEPAQRAWQTVTLSATTAWQLLGKEGELFATHVARTTNGTDWTSQPITGGTPGFRAGHLAAIDANTAYISQYNDDGGGEVLKTTNGGASWVKITTTEYTSPGSYLNWTHFFDASTGVAFGDPVQGGYEIYRTTNAGASWQRVPAAAIPAPLVGEAGLLLSYFALGNTLWVGTANFGVNGEDDRFARVWKSTDRGLTWTVSARTPLRYGVYRLAFRDQNNGIAYNSPDLSIPGGGMIRTTDGGQTWSAITPVSTPQGRFYGVTIDAIPGGFLSVGEGSSISADGITWTDLTPGGGTTAAFTTLDALSATVAFAGATTAAATDSHPGSGGVYQLRGNLLTPLRPR
ncbi:hypothetical protein SAMN00120144_2157 [Hymenobacter roseosalivarius DSM 11622]|uniref:Photosynthesis system II assembly factor Ycf48/Hcf136-like domain-containing protein n=1 Tax=Hymenobacter roseosalivarius DSM 11622 TaxID=645990 RepID=A0A1W1VGE6_9BACT|nr:hypothetical protein [Hymenobacter roseosalivarius]SMB92432.1 hypothetical protein SAMN00120144_2157 [Hymenobacter roseosalivarius DSM 11622]